LQIYNDTANCFSVEKLNEDRSKTKKVFFISKDTSKLVIKHRWKY